MPVSFAQLRQAFRFNEEAGRYILPNGRFVPEREVKRAVNTFVDRARGEIKASAGQVARGELTIDEWQIATASSLKNLHLAARAAGKGGLNQLDNRDFGHVGATLRFQYERLDKFARQVEAGQVKPEAIESRAEMYAASANGSFEEGRRDSMETAGFTHERRILGAAEHCEDCVEAAELDWQPIGTLPQIGESRCLTNCKCSFEFKREEDGDEVESES